MARAPVPRRGERNASGGAMPKITKRLVEAAEVRVKDYIICDDELKGFAVRVLPSGRRAYIIQYWQGKRYRRMSLGLHGVLTTEKARRMAFGMLASVKEGEDPAGDRREGRTAVMVAELAERFIREHIAVRLKPGTAREYRRNLRRFILPAIGRLRVVDVTRADIARFHHQLRHIPYQANRNLEVISKMFQLAELWACGRMDRTRGGTSGSIPRRSGSAISAPLSSARWARLCRWPSRRASRIRTASPPSGC